MTSCREAVRVYRQLKQLHSDNLLTSIEVDQTFTLPTGECIGLLGVTSEDIILDSPCDTDPRAGRDEQRAAAVVAAEESLRGGA